MKYVMLFLALSCATQSRDFLKKDIAPHVYQLSAIGNQLCTAFNLKYKGKTVTLTNAHCCEEVLPTTMEGSVVKIIKKDIPADLCIIKSDKSLRGLDLSEDDVELMDEVYSIGFPAGYGKTIRQGRVTNQVMTNNNFSFPVVNREGKVVGVIAMRNMHMEGLFIKLEVLKDFLNGN